MNELLLWVFMDEALLKKGIVGTYVLEEMKSTFLYVPWASLHLCSFFASHPCWSPKRFSDLVITNTSINADGLLTNSSTLKAIRSTLAFPKTLLAESLSQPPWRCTLWLEIPGRILLQVTFCSPYPADHGPHLRSLSAMARRGCGAPR